MSANSHQVAGQHYSATIQHWDYVLRTLSGRYLEGNITKYVCRHRKKNGVQDLQKALHYLDKLEEQFVSRSVFGIETCNTSFPMAEFIASNGLNTAEAYIVKRLAHWYRVDHLEVVRQKINNLIEDERDRQRQLAAIKVGAPTYSGAEASKAYTNQG